MSERPCAFICLCDKGRALLRDALVPVVVHCCCEHNDWLQFVSQGWMLSDMKDHQLTALSGAQRQTEKFLRRYQTVQRERGISSFFFHWRKEIIQQMRRIRRTDNPDSTEYQVLMCELNLKEKLFFKGVNSENTELQSRWCKNKFSLYHNKQKSHQKTQILFVQTFLQTSCFIPGNCSLRFTEVHLSVLSLPALKRHTPVVR